MELASSVNGTGLKRQVTVTKCWIAEGVTGENCFPREFKQKLTDVVRQDWMTGINSAERFIQNRKFKLVLEPEHYLDSIRQKCFGDRVREVKIVYK